MSPWVLATSYFFHLAATVLWIGGLVVQAMVVWPAVRQTLGSDPQQAVLLREIRRRFTPLANLSLVVLVITGLIQTSGDPNYNGLLVFDSDWSRAILLKHIAILGMVIVGVVLQWGVAPAQERMALLQARGKEAPDAESLDRRERRLTLINLGLGVLVLVFTAFATAL